MRPANRAVAASSPPTRHPEDTALTDAAHAAEVQAHRPQEYQDEEHEGSRNGSPGHTDPSVRSRTTRGRGSRPRVVRLGNFSRVAGRGECLTDPDVSIRAAARWTTAEGQAPIPDTDLANAKPACPPDHSPGQPVSPPHRGIIDASPGRLVAETGIPAVNPICLHRLTATDFAASSRPAPSSMMAWKPSTTRPERDRARPVH